MGEATAVSLRSVSRIYNSNGANHPAVSDVSLEVRPGEFVAIMGPSGCGKSTLLNIIGGIDRPDAGQVTVGATAVHALSETKLALFRRHQVGIVFQYYNLVGNLNVLSNVEMPALLAGAPRAAVQTRAAELLSALGVGELANKMPSQLSGGQQQRVAIARALINRPAVLLADEPTGALDQESGQAVMRLFRKLHGDGQTIIMVTHDPRVSGNAERILMMEDGRIAEEIQQGVTQDDPGDAARSAAVVGRLLRGRW